VPEQPAEESLTANVPRRRGVVRGKFLGRPGCRLRQRAIAERLMRPEVIVEAAELGCDVLQMAQAEAEEVVQALAFECADPALGEGICIGRQHRGANRRDASILEHAIEARWEFPITIVQHELGRQPLSSSHMSTLRACC
jgi:hypothetical protein